jgi:hypothetical protein
MLSGESDFERRVGVVIVEHLVDRRVAAAGLDVVVGGIGDTPFLAQTPPQLTQTLAAW